MSCLKFKKDNILNWEAILIELNPTTEVFGLIKFKEFEPMEPILSELDAIEKVESVKQFHKDNEVRKKENFYKQLKLQIMELNDKGLKKVDEHIFQDGNGNNLNLILN